MAVSKKCILVVAQTLKLVQGDGVCFEILPLTAFAERLVAGARGRLLPPWVTDAGGIRSEASSGLPPPWVKKDAGGILSAAYGGFRTCANLL